MLKRNFSQSISAPHISLYPFASIASIDNLSLLRPDEDNPLAAPLLIYMDVCNLCNFRCKFCAAQMMKPDGYKRQLMSLELYKKIIDDIAGFPTPLKTLRFVGGGEPLINKELPEMIAYAKALLFAATVFSQFY